LIVCGVYAHIGCMLTTADAFMHDIQPFFVGDAVADFSADEHAMAVNYVSQRCGMVLSTEQIVQRLTPTPAKGTLPHSVEDLRREVATLLQMPASDLRLDDSLLDLGLDSIRLMTLVERWRAIDPRITFIALAEQATLQAWWPLLSPQRQGA
jgi:bifunctional isochorismate lyase / aryl carrier protein